MRPVILIMMMIFLVGCARHNVQVYGIVNQNNKTVTVPAGSKGLKGELKKTLSMHGWKLAVDRGPSVTKGRLGEQTDLMRYDTFKTKYRLLVSARQVDICLNLSPSYVYEISFIDNDSGSEIFTIDGDGCESRVISKFENALRGIGG